MTQIDDPWHMLSDEERMFCEVLERVCVEKIAPRAAETDETARFVHEELATLGEIGVMGANLPEEYGGSGISAPALLRAVAIVAAACGSTASALTAHYLATDSILIGGTDGQKQEWLSRAATGEALGAFALTEPTAGSDPADMKTRARRTESGWHIKGTKCFISNGGVADFVVVYAVTDPDKAHRGISAFILPKGTPGFEVVKERYCIDASPCGLKGGSCEWFGQRVSVQDPNTGEVVNFPKLTCAATPDGFTGPMKATCPAIDAKTGLPARRGKTASDKYQCVISQVCEPGYMRGPDGLICGVQGQQ